MRLRSEKAQIYMYSSEKYELALSKVANRALNSPIH